MLQWLSYVNMPATTPSLLPITELVKKYQNGQWRSVLFSMGICCPSLTIGELGKHAWNVSFITVYVCVCVCGREGGGDKKKGKLIWHIVLCETETSIFVSNLHFKYTKCVPSKIYMISWTHCSGQKVANVCCTERQCGGQFPSVSIKPCTPHKMRITLWWVISKVWGL